jgi:hypothetical protein
MSTAAVALDRERLIGWYRRNRERSRTIFDLLVDDAYYSQPIALRHPIVFYEGHLPAFSFNTLVKRGLGRPSIDPQLEALFARGIDPHESQRTGSAARAQDLWPARAVVQQFAAEADRRCSTRSEGPTSTSRGILCSTERRPPSASSNTRRCTRRRCFTCGIGCRSSRNTVPQGTP